MSSSRRMYSRSRGGERAGGRRRASHHGGHCMPVPLPPQWRSISREGREAPRGRRAPRRRCSCADADRMGRKMSRPMPLSAKCRRRGTGHPRRTDWYGPAEVTLCVLSNLMLDDLDKKLPRRGHPKHPKHPSRPFAKGVKNFSQVTVRNGCPGLHQYDLAEEPICQTQSI